MWQELGFTDKEIRSLPGRFAVGVVAPQLLFYFGLREGAVTAAIAAAGGWTAGFLLYDLMRRRLLDPFLLFGFVLTVVQGLVALYARSAVIFAGGGIAENLLEGLALLGSIAVCRPLLVEVVGSATRGQAQAVLTLPMRAALGRLTIVWGLALLARSAGLYAALTHLAIGHFLVVNTLAGWPLTGVGVVLSVAYVRAQSGNAPGMVSRCNGMMR